MYFVTNRIYLNYNEQNAIKGIISDVTSKYPVKRIIIYGSKARGDFLEDSDIDLIFVTEGKMDRLTRFQISDIIYQYELYYDIVISAIFVTESEFKDRVNTFFMKVKKEGIVIWSRG